MMWLLKGSLSKCNTMHNCGLIYCGYQDVMALKQQGPRLQVRQTGNDIHTDIERKNPYTPHKTLGRFKAPGGNGAMQLNILKCLAHKYTIKVMTSALTHIEARMLLQIN
eukprot:12264666-Ditylum_brightwellii.AAC.1